MMSGTSSPGPAPDALELAALLCSRVCHDLISPVGAIVNGLEVLDDNPKPEDRQDRFGAIAVLPPGVWRCGVGGCADRSGRRTDHGARPHRGWQDHHRLEFAAAAAAEESRQAVAE